MQGANRRAREAHPIAPQLDGCRLLVGQERLPEFSSVTSPSESVLAQICILKNGFRHGGHIDVLLGLWEDMRRFSPSGSAQITTYKWSQHRIYVFFCSNFILLMSKGRNFTFFLGYCHVYVPRTDALLCRDYWNSWSLFFIL